MNSTKLLPTARRRRSGNKNPYISPLKTLPKDSKTIKINKSNLNNFLPEIGIFEMELEIESTTIYQIK